MLSLLTEVLQDVYERVLDALPSVMAALALALAGWALAIVLRWLLTRSVGGLTHRFLSSRRYAASLGSSTEGLGKLVGNIAFWITLLIFLTAALERLEFQIFAGLVGEVTQYIPNVFLALIVLFAGLAGGRLARQGIRSALPSAAQGETELVGRVCQAAIVLVAAVVAADQIGVDSTFLMLIIAIAMGTTLGGVALGFGMGSAPIVSNIIAAYYVRRMYRRGAVVRVGAVEGRIVDIGPTTVLIETSDGRVRTPCRKFVDEASVEVRDS